MIKALFIFAALSACFYQTASAKEVLQEITVKDGDTIWGIANVYLKDPKKWPEILKYNQIPLSDPTATLPGMKLKVPVQLIREELRKADIIFLLNDVRYRKRNESEWRKAVKDAELLNDYGLRTLEDSQVHVRFYSGDILKLDQNSLVVLRPELKVEEVNLLAGTLQAGRVKLVTQTAQVTPLTKDTLYKARLRIDKGLIVQVERGSTEVMGTLSGKKVVVGADQATIAHFKDGPIEPVTVGKTSGMETVDFDASNRVIVPAGHANITFPDKAPTIPVKVPNLPNFDMMDFDESGKAKVPSLYGNEAKKRQGGSPDIAPVAGYRPGSAGNMKISGVDGSGSRAQKKEVKVRKFFRIQFSLEPSFSRPALDKKNPIGVSDPLGDNNEYGLTDGIYFRRISYQDNEGNETDFIDLPKLEIDNLPPRLMLSKPAEKFTTRKQFVQVEGQTEPQCFVRVNDYQVPIKQDAKISWSVLLKEGENKISITVTDKKKRVTRMERTVIKLGGSAPAGEEEN